SLPLLCAIAVVVKRAVANWLTWKPCAPLTPSSVSSSPEVSLAMSMVTSAMEWARSPGSNWMFAFQDLNVPLKGWLDHCTVKPRRLLAASTFQCCAAQAGDAASNAARAQAYLIARLIG